ncbi:MAG TPA: hypothetical protein VMR96_06915 [Solirubrobacterales bacterium]|nr:hypothetical protein [Solirubrobacterales bacterium]
MHPRRIRENVLRQHEIDCRQEPPWPVFAEASTIRITEVPVRMLFGASGECADWSTTGEMTATPNSQTAISTTSLAGELKTGGFTTFKYTGSLSLSPAERYGFYP